ncbi:MAG: class I SAM-dependent methyltransferase [Thermoleophilaceae bacterium]
MADALRDEVERIRWFHTIRLRDDLVTPGLEPDTPAKLEHLRLPADLSGRTVLDVGTWDGFFAFEAERRGAARVVATDHHAWNAAGWGDAGFRCAHHAFGSSVETQDVDVLDHTPERLGTFDVVFFLGVLYHMRHPLLALERMAAMTHDMLVLETHVESLGVRRPLAAFYPGAELNDDDSNWWGPNLSAVEAMLRAAGFTRVERVFPTSRSDVLARGAYKAARALAGKVRRGEPTLPAAVARRAAFHAWR